MESVTSFTSLLEAAKRCLIHTEWERPSHPSHAAAHTAHRASSSSSSLSFSPLHSPSRAESTAAAVFCQLMDMQHLRGVVQAAVARQKANARQQADGVRRAPTSLSMASSPARMAAHPDKENGRKQQQRHSHNSSSNKDRNGAEQGKINALRVVVNDAHDDEQGMVSCAVQRYLAVLQSCDVCVQSLCFLTALLQPGGGLAEQLEIILSPVDVIDVFFSLVLCVAVALCWQHKQQQQQQQQEQQTAHSALVSSSRDTSLHSRGGSTGGSAKAVASPPSVPAASPYAAVKDYYYTKDRHRQHDHHSALSSSKEDRNGRASSSSARSCQAVLKAVLPLLERRLPFTQLWRAPSLLAAVDVLARGLWVAQERVHAHTPPRPYASDASHSASVGAVRCPMCYAAALDSGLALEALTQLQHYYVIYRSDSDGGHTAGSESDGGEEEEDERRLVAVKDSQGGKDDDDTNGHHDVGAARLRSAPQSARALGWVAACRIALWNHRASPLRCLTRCDVPPWVPAGVTADTSRFLAARDSPMAALQLLWVRWWEAEVRLAASPLPHVAAASARGTARLIERTEEMQLCSCQLFLRHFIDDWVSDVDYDGTANGEGGGGERRGSGRVGWQRRQRLHRLLCIPLAVGCKASPSISSSPTAAATAAAVSVAAAPDRGTLFHWLCAHKGSSSLLLRLLVLAAEGDLSRLRPTAPQNASLPSPAADTAAVATAPSAHGTQRLESAQERRTSFTSHAAPHVVQLGRDETQREKAGVSCKAHPSWHSPSSSSTDVMRRHCSAALLGTLRLADSCGHTALDVACQHGDAYAVRLLLERGLSPNSLDEGLWQRYESTLSLPLLRLLYDPSLLDGATTTTKLGSGNNSSSSSDAKVSLADRLRATHCRAAAGRMLAQLAYRLWTEKVASSARCAVLATPSPTVHAPFSSEATPTAGEEEGEEATQPVTFTEWSASYAACRAAHDRVLRPALAALEYDPHEPMARLTVLAVLTRQLQEWLTTVPPDMRSPTAGPSSPPHHGSVSASGAAHAPRSGAAAAGKKGEEEEAAMSLREVRQQHTAALRLYTQLTCPLGRHLLHSAVAARTAVCAAVDARAAATAAVVLAAARARPLPTPVPSASANGDVTQEEHLIKATMTDVNDGECIRSAERRAGAAVAECASAVDDQVPLPLSEAAKAQRELQHLYASVLRDVQQLDASLAAEQRRILATAPHPDAQDTDKTAQTATVLRGIRRPLSRPHHHHHHRYHDDDNTEGVRETATPTYVLVTIPSFAALHRARLQGSVAAARALHGSSSSSDSSARGTAGWEVIEPTLWCAAPHTPRQVWLRLPQELDLDALLSAQDGGGYGVVAQDMPLVAPVQRGDLVTFRLTSPSSASSASPSACASPPQFVVQAIFSEWRTAPFMLYRQPQQQQQQQLKEASLPVSLPRTVILPFLRCTQSTALECQRQSRGGREAARNAVYGGHREHNLEDKKEVGKLSHQETNMTLHACCLAAVYTDEAVAEDNATTAAGTQHPLDWLQVRSAKVGTGADVVSVLRTNSAFATRWARIVYAGLQPCWRASTAVDTVSKKLRQRASTQQHTKASHSGDGGGDGGGDREGAQETVVLSDPFSTYEEPSGEEVAGEGYLADTSKGNGSVLYTTLTVRRADRIHPSVPMADPVGSLWPQRIDGGDGAAVGDAVVDVTL